MKAISVFPGKPESVHLTDLDKPKLDLNLEFVLGNKVMVGTVNANREYFELGSAICHRRSLSIPAG